MNIGTLIVTAAVWLCLGAVGLFILKHGDDRPVPKRIIAECLILGPITVLVALFVIWRIDVAEKRAKRRP